MLALAACSTGGGTTASAGIAPSTNGKGKTITLWLVGGDTPDALRTYLKTEFHKETKGTLKIEQQDWCDIVTKLTTSLPDKNNTPDVTEMGNTQSPTFTNVGAFLDISDMYKELGGIEAAASFVEAGKVDGKNYTLPYYFGSRYVFYRKDVWAKAGITSFRPRSTSSTRMSRRSMRRTPTTSRTSRASTWAAKTGAMASRGSSRTVETSPRSRAASGLRPWMTRRPSRA